MDNKEVRIPRPLGITYQSINLRSHTQDPQQTKILREKMQTMILKQWIANGLMLNNISYSIEDMISYTGLPLIAIQRAMNTEFMVMKRILGKEELGTLASVLISLSLKKILETEALSRSRVRMLETSEGGEYKPFVSSEVNKSYQNLMTSQKQIVDLTKILLDAGKTTNILIQNNAPQGAQSHAHLGTDEALILINKAHKSLIEDEQGLEDKLGTLKGLPDINGRNQDLTKIGIRHKGDGPNVPENSTQLEQMGQSNSKVNEHEERANKALGLEILDVDWDEFIS